MNRLVGVLLLVAITAWPQPAAVWCIVPGGHVAIEPGPERCDTSGGAVHDPRESAHAALTPAETCCAPCTDVPLGTRVLGGPGRPDDHLHALTEAAGRAPAVLPAVDRGPATAPQSGPAAGALLTPAATGILRSTIVLRC